MENKMYTKEQIKDAIWQELKESGYTGDNNDRAYEVIGIVVAGIEKITPTKAQPGPRWVKCSDRMPGYNQMVKWRQEGGQATPGTSSLLDIRAHLSCLSQWEWLDEQHAAGREEDAVAFAEWILKNDLEATFNDKGKSWVDFRLPRGKNKFTTAELYKLFKQHNP